MVPSADSRCEACPIASRSRCQWAAKSPCAGDVLSLENRRFRLKSGHSANAVRCFVAKHCWFKVCGEPATSEKVALSGTFWHYFGGGLLSLTGTFVGPRSRFSSPGPGLAGTPAKGEEMSDGGGFASGADGPARAANRPGAPDP
jgi:hypothetical protein